MGKLQDKRIELAKRILDTTDADKLARVEDALEETRPYVFSAAEVKEFKAIRDRIRNGSVTTYTLEEVKRRAKQRVVQ